MSTCRSTTYAVHQFRHLTKVRSADGKAKFEARVKSKESMESHVSTFADLPESLVVKLFSEHVRSEITEHAAAHS